MHGEALVCFTQCHGPILSDYPAVTDQTISPERQLKAAVGFEQRGIGHEVVGIAEDLDVSAGSLSHFDRPQLGDWLPIGSVTDAVTGWTASFAGCSTGGSDPMMPVSDSGIGYRRASAGVGDGEQPGDADRVEDEHDEGVQAHPAMRRRGRKSRPAT